MWVSAGDYPTIQQAMDVNLFVRVTTSSHITKLTWRSGNILLIDPGVTLTIDASAEPYALVASGSLSNVGIIGYGEASVIDWSAVGVPINLANFSGATSVLMKNFRVTGNASQTAPQVGLNITGAIRPVVRGTQWIDTNVDCIRLANAQDFRIIGNGFKNTGRRSGIFANRCILAGSAVNGVISHNVARTTGPEVYMIDCGNAVGVSVCNNVGTDLEGAIDFESSNVTIGNDSVISGNDFTGKSGAGGNWGGYGIWLTYSGAGAGRHVVTGNKVRGFAINYAGTINYNCSITGNQSYNAEREGMVFTAGFNNTISSNNVSDCSAGTSRRLMMSAMTGGYFVGETITGGTSSATGRVIGSDANVGEVVYAPLTGTFVSGEVVTGGTSTTTGTSATGPIKFSGLRFWATANGFAGGSVSGNTVSGINHQYSIEGAANSSTASNGHTFDWVSMQGNQCFDKPTSLAGRIKERGTVTNLSLVFPGGDTTPAVDHGDAYYSNNSSATLITDFDSTCFDREITVIFGDSNTTLSFSGGTLKGNNGVNYTFQAGEMLIARRNRNISNNASVWHCQILK